METAPPAPPPAQSPALASSPSISSDSSSESDSGKLAQVSRSKLLSSQTSARFRYKRKIKHQRMLEAIDRESTKIELYKSRMRKLEVENELLRKMVLGPSSLTPLSLGSPESPSDPVGALISDRIGHLSNYELHKRLNRD